MVNGVAVAAVADDRVQRLGDDDRPLGLLVGAGQQLAELVGGQEQAVALVVLAVDRHAHAVQQAGGGDHHLGVALAQPEVGGHARHHAAAEQQPGQAQRDVEHDLDVHPGVVAHAQPARGVDRRDVPPRLDLVVVVDRLEQRLEPPVAARRRAHRASRPAPRAGRSGGCGSGHGLGQSRSGHRQLQHDALAQAAADQLQRHPERGRTAGG